VLVVMYRHMISDTFADAGWLCLDMISWDRSTNNMYHLFYCLKQHYMECSNSLK